MQRSPEVVTANSTSRRQVGLVISFLIAAGLVAAPLVTTTDSQAAEVAISGSSPTELSQVESDKPTKLESPDGDCFEWKYPNKPECGSLAGKTECKAEPSINTLEKDEDKRKACGVEEGAECFCGEDDEDEDEDEDDDF